MKAIFVLFLLPLQLFSQDVSGIWVGTIATSQVEMPFELAINQDMSGYSMVTFMYKGAEKVAVKRITLNRKDSVFTISDDKLIYNNFEMKSRNIKTFCELSIKMVDSTMVLSGAFHTRTRDLKAGDEDLSTGTITLRKQNRQAQTRLIGKLDTLKLSNTLVFSDPKPVIKEDQLPPVIEEDPPAVAKNPVKDSTVKKVQQQASITTAPAIPTKQKVIEPNSSAPKIEAPAVARNPVKDSTVAKVQQQVSTTTAPALPTKQKVIEPNSSALNNITAPPAIPAKQKIIAAAADIASRKTVVIRTIDFKSDSLTLTLFDNGIVDGDTVSVVLNGEVIIPRLGLTEQPYRKVIQIPPGLGDSLQLVMYAENLGTIPPNSGLLIIEDGADRHSVGFEGDMQKSSAVTLRRKR